MFFSKNTRGIRRTKVRLQTRTVAHPAACVKNAQVSCAQSFYINYYDHSQLSANRFSCGWELGLGSGGDGLCFTRAACSNKLLEMFQQGDKEETVSHGPEEQMNMHINNVLMS